MATPPKKQHISEERREKARQTALRLVEEGRFGGRGPGDDPSKTWGQRGRGRRPKHVPRPEHFVAILLAVEGARNPGASKDVLRSFRLMPKAFPLDRKRMLELVTSTLQALLARHFLPEKAIVHRDGTVELLSPRARRRPHGTGETLVELFEPGPNDYATYVDHQLLDVLVLLSETHVYPCAESKEAVEFVSQLAHRVSAAARSVLIDRKGESIREFV